MAKPSPDSAATAPLLVVELWGLGDVALAIPFLRQASLHRPVTLVAKPHASPLLRRFAPAVRHEILDAPWTAFRGKYRLWQWPWRELRRVVSRLRAGGFEAGVSARPDPRDHLLLRLAGVRRRLGFPRAGSGALLTTPLPPPSAPHRAEHWRAVARQLGWDLGQPSAAPTRPSGTRRILIHTGAGQVVRRWPRERFELVAGALRTQGWEVTVVDDALATVDALVEALASTDRFIGNDSGPGHVAALLGIPTFTLFGPQLPELFAPTHPQAGWIEGAPCPYKPCFDACRFPTARCLLSIEPDAVIEAVRCWLDRTAT